MDILVTKRLTLRPPLEVDIDDIAEFIGNKNVSRMLHRVPYPYFKKDAEDWIGHVSKNVDAGLDMAFTIHRERLIGVMTLEGFDGVPQLGYWLAEPYWGKGFATEAGAAVLEHAFKTRDIERVVSGVFKDNPASLHVQKKLGFRLAGNGSLWSPARGEMVEDFKTELTRRDFVAAGHALQVFPSPLRGGARGGGGEEDVQGEEKNSGHVLQAQHFPHHPTPDLPGRATGLARLRPPQGGGETLSRGAQT
jgi:RimJ/RimL family protein N-acetyltransferase